MTLRRVALKSAALLACLTLPAWIPAWQFVDQSPDSGSWLLIDPVIRSAVRSQLERERINPAADPDESELFSALETVDHGLITASQYALAERNRAEGRARMEARDWGRAITCFKRQIRGAWCVAQGLFDLATAYAMQGDLERALAHLEHAVAAGFFRIDQIENAPSLARLRLDHRYTDIKLRAMSTASLRSYAGITPDKLRDHYRDTLRQHPDDGPTLHRFGCASVALGDLDAAQKAFERQVELGFSSGTAFYNLACCLARKGKQQDAFDYLERAVAAGAPSPNFLRADPDLERLRADPRFEAILASIDQRRG